MEHLKPYEQAARNYCGKASIDPDTPVSMPHPAGLLIPYAVPQWHIVAEDLLHLSMQLTSLREAATAQVKPAAESEH